MYIRTTFMNSTAVLETLCKLGKLGVEMSQTLQEQVPSLFVVCSTTPIRTDEKDQSEKEKKF